MIDAINPGNPSQENAKKMEDLNKKKTDILERLEANKNGDCPICMIPFDDETTSTICNHCFKCFHSECITGWLSTHPSCPNCRAVVQFKNLLYIPKKKNEDDDYKEDEDEDEDEEEVEEDVEEVLYNNRAEAFTSLIKHINKPENRVLVFAGYDAVQKQAIIDLEIQKVKYASVKGGVDTRAKKLQSFKKGEVNFLVLDSREDSAGIDLPETTHIIIYHEMPEHFENQIIGRGQRIGRNGSLVVYNLTEE